MHAWHKSTVGMGMSMIHNVGVTYVNEQKVWYARRETKGLKVMWVKDDVMLTRPIFCIESIQDPWPI
jgi:hypothetical protein